VATRSAFVGSAFGRLVAYFRHVGPPTFQDLIAGVTVAVVALPLAIAFGLTSGATAAAGLYAAIFGGFFASLFGGSRVNITGPTGAMAVVLMEITARHGIEGMLLAGFIAGLMQIVLGWLKAGRLIKFLPHCLIVGFTSGIAIVIFQSQIASFLLAPLVGLAAGGAMMIAKLLWPKSPAALIGLFAGIAANFVVGGPTVEGVPRTLPAPGLVWPTLEMLQASFGAAVTICLLGSIEGLLSATVADSMMGTRHDANRELIGQGVGNLMSSLFGGVPVTGAVARTGVAVRSGARSPWTGMIHSIVLLLVVVALAPLAKYVPLSALAGILMVTAVWMVEWEGIKLIPRAPAHYRAVLLVTMVLTVLTDLTIAVGVGFALATLLFTLRLAKQPLKETDLVISDHGRPVHADNVVIHAVNGPLFFGVAESILERFEASPHKDVLVLDMRRVPLIDASGAIMLHKLAARLKKGGGRLVVYGLDPEAKAMLRAFTTPEDQSAFIVVDRPEELLPALAS